MEKTKSEKIMLGLKMPTDPYWVKNIVANNIGEILTDHAWCEQKAASNAISTIVRYPEYSDMVDELTEIAQEEIEHFAQVRQKIKDRGLTLGFERKDAYVRDLAKGIKKGGSRTMQLVESLLFAAMIEARSCERFRVLSENIEDPDLKIFYHELMISEAGHYSTFLKYARKYGEGVDVDARWNEFLAYEAKVIQRYGKSETIHG